MMTIDLGCTVVKLWKPVAGFLVKTVCARLFSGSKDIKQRVFSWMLFNRTTSPLPFLFSSRLFHSLVDEQEISVSFEEIV